MKTSNEMQSVLHDLEVDWEMFVNIEASRVCFNTIGETCDSFQKNLRRLAEEIERQRGPVGMLELISTGCYPDQKNGWKVFAIEPHTHSLSYQDIDEGVLFNKIVSINGIQYRVKGVETFCINREPDDPVKFQFGLMVEEV